MNRRTFRFASFALALVASAGLSAAQNTSNDEGVLKGPSVKDGGAPGKNRKFSEKGGKGAYHQREVPMRQYARAFQVLKADKLGDKSSDGVVLTVDQEEEIQDIMEGFRTTAQAFREKNGKEIKELARALPPEERRKVMTKLGEFGGPGPGQGEGNANGSKGKRPPKGERPEGQRSGDDDMMDAPPSEKASQAEIDTAISRLKELGESAPKPSEAQTKMWAVLNDAQKPLVKAELERMKVETEKRRGERMRDGGGPGAEGGRGQGMTPEMREKLKNMSPEERQDAIRKFRENRQAEGGAPGAKGQKPSKKGNKAPTDDAPGMEDVDVPDPE